MQLAILRVSDHGAVSKITRAGRVTVAISDLLAGGLAGIGGEVEGRGLLRASPGAAGEDESEEGGGSEEAKPVHPSTLLYGAPRGVQAR